MSPWSGQIVTPHSIVWKVIFKLNGTKILVYSSALQSKKVQSSINKFHWSKKLRKTDNFSFILNIRVSLEGVNLFLHVFLYLTVILTMEHYINLLTIFHLKICNFLELTTCPVKLGTTCPIVIFLLATGSRPPCLRYLCCCLAHVFGNRTPYKII